MRLFGLEIRKAAPTGLQAVAENRGGWIRIIREAFTGAFQRDIEWTTSTVVAYHAVYTCITLISSDIGKLRPKLVQFSKDDIWEETDSPAFSPVLRKPNRYQNHIQFKESWITSKLMHGNTYALKVRDARGVVRALYILDPTRVTPLVAPDGSIYYQLKDDNLSGLQEAVTVPASEIIHDRMNCLFHPLVGTSPIFASGHAANLGLNVQANSAKFFGNGSNPSGILSIPGNISPEDAKRASEEWNARFTGDSSGAVAVLAGGITFQPMRMTSVDAQLIQQLKWTSDVVCSTFHVPPFKVGLGQMPTYQNAEVMNQIYYSDCLQSLIEQMELCLDEGLGLTEPKDGKMLGVELDLDALLRMDTATQHKVLGEGIAAALLTPNEARKKIDLPPIKGGDTVYMQQQEFSLEALHDRDQDKPFAKPTAAAPALPPGEPEAAPKDKGIVDAEWWVELSAEVEDVTDDLVFGDPLQVDAEVQRLLSPVALLGSGKP